MAPLDQIRDTSVQAMVREYNDTFRQLASESEQRLRIRNQYEQTTHEAGELTPEAIRLRNALDLVNLEVSHAKEAVSSLRRQLRSRCFYIVAPPNGQTAYYTLDSMKQHAEHGRCKGFLVVSNDSLDLTHLVFRAGGAVVGNIPRGLPQLSLPPWDTSVAINLLSMAMIISLLGFMEAISIAKAMAAKTGQRIDPDQELMGQGLSNIVGSMSLSYAVSGSFSRSAVNLQAGAVTGFSNVISSAVVVVVLLFLTPLLYHLPQAVLAAIIMMAVVGLINIQNFVHAWRAQRHDGIIGVITFVSTLAFAPHLDRGILIGVALSLLHYLVRNTKPAIAMLSLHEDRSYQNRDRYNYRQCRHIAVIRYAGSLFFANVSYLEGQLTAAVDSMPELKQVILVGNGINELDASGVDALEIIVERLESRGLKFALTGLNDNVNETMKRTGLLARIGEENVYRSVSRAIDTVWHATHEGSDEQRCPLRFIPTRLVLPTAPGARMADNRFFFIRPQKRPRINRSLNTIRIRAHSNPRLSALRRSHVTGRCPIGVQSDSFDVNLASDSSESTRKVPGRLNPTPALWDNALLRNVAKL